MSVTALKRLSVHELNDAKLSASELVALLQSTSPQKLWAWQRQSAKEVVGLDLTPIAEVHASDTPGFVSVKALCTHSTSVVPATPSHLHHALKQLQLSTIPPSQAVRCSSERLFLRFFCFSYDLGELLQGTQRPSITRSHETGRILGLMAQARAWLELNEEGWVLCSLASEQCALLDCIRDALSAKRPSATIVDFGPCSTREAYSKNFDRIQGYLRAGDAYQVNLAQRFSGSLVGNTAALLGKLDQSTKAPFAGALFYKQLSILSCSPELFLTFKPHENGLQLVTKPIKGTIRRGTNTAEDSALAQALAQSEKDRSENLMIVDLLRNDLGVVAKVGSVHTTKLFELESFKQVHHLVSTITAELKDDVDPLFALLHSLPGGSITGAPKKRVCEIIAELEHEPRGFYCGSLGFLDENGQGEFNLMIRTLEVRDGDLSLWAGGGITIASELDSEYEECLTKVSGICAVLDSFRAD